MNKAITTLDGGTGQKLLIVGGIYRILISGAETNGAYAVIDMQVPPGGGPGPHAHKNIQEMFYVVEGELHFRTEAGSYFATAGAFINIPLGGAIHSFKNETDMPAHLVCTVVPAGLESFFQEIGKPVPTEGAVSPSTSSSLSAPSPPSAEEQERLISIAKKYGQELYPPDYLK